MKTAKIHPIQPAIAGNDYKKIDAAIWELCQGLWRIESIANLASRALDGNGDGSQFFSDLNGSFQAIAMLCKECQDTLEVGIQRPNDAAIASTKQSQS